MKIKKFYSQTDKKILLKNGRIIRGPDYKNYVYVHVETPISPDKLDDYISDGYIYLPINHDYTSGIDAEKLDIVQKKDIVQLNSVPDTYFKLWKKIEKEDVKCVYDLLLFMIVNKVRVLFAKILDEGKVIETSDSGNEPGLGKLIRKEPYDRDMYLYYYQFPVEAIDSFHLKITYYNLDKFGETKYLDELKIEEYCLDMHKPNMEIYELMRSHGMLEIEWE